MGTITEENILDLIERLHTNTEFKNKSGLERAQIIGEVYAAIQNDAPDKLQLFEENLKKKQRLGNIVSKISLEFTPECTEIEASRLYAKVFKNELRYNTTAKTYYYYNRKYWERDAENVHAHKCAKEFAKAIMVFLYSSDANIFDKDHEKASAQKEQLIKFYSKYSKKSNRDALISDAITEIAISEDDFDKKANLLNVRNGTINLNTFELDVHRPDDLLTNYADVEYIPGCTSKLWSSFISEIFPHDKALQSYVQKILGYAITGEPTLERMFVFYGSSTRNGKSTLLNAISEVLGTYSKNTPADTLQLKVRDSSKPSEDLARLSKCRFLTVSEPDKSMIFDIPLIKTLTGGDDKVTARRLNESSFEYIPKFVIIMNTNFLPRMLDTSLLDSNRVDVIPFKRHFKVAERDIELKQKLRAENEKSAILSWLIEGLKQYKQDGLIPVLTVQTATREYANQSDKLQMFLDECLEYTDEKPSLTAGECYTMFKDWCAASGYSPEGKQRFMDMLRHKNILLPSASINGKTVRNVISGFQKCTICT